MATSAAQLDGALPAEIAKANPNPKTYQGRTSKGTFGSGTRSWSGQSSTPKDKELDQRHAADTKPRTSSGKLSGQAGTRQAPPKMEMVHGRRDKLTKDLESTRISNRSIPQKANPDAKSGVQAAHEHLANLQSGKGDVKSFVAHIQTMSPDEIRQFQKESGMRGKTAETLAKEAHIAAQERSQWQQKCRREGISVAHFKQVEKQIRDEHQKYVNRYNAMLDDVAHPDLRAQIRGVAGAGGDFVTLETKHGVKFDLIAEDAARRYPEYFGDANKTHHEDKLWQYALAGKQQPMRKSEAFRQAFAQLMEQKHSGEYRRVPLRKQRNQGWDDEVPF